MKPILMISSSGLTVSSEFDYPNVITDYHIPGGPGCSSLEGFLQENGPIQWTWGQAHPSPNPYPWTNLSHVLWVEQPVGTGFSQGTPNITTDDELAAQLVGFMGQFLETFPGLKGKNFYATGESYAGYYVPYIANYIYNHPGVIDLALKGIWIADPSLSYGVVQEQIPALRFAQANANVFPFTNATWTALQNISDTCGYTDYLDKYVTYPPQGLLPLPRNTSRVTRDCDIFDSIIDEVYQLVLLHLYIIEDRLIVLHRLNPAFNIYRVTETYPNPCQF
jgi:carboxypeptidase D